MIGGCGSLSCDGVLYEVALLNVTNMDPTKPMIKAYDCEGAKKFKDFNAFVNNGVVVYPCTSLSQISPETVERLMTRHSDIRLIIFTLSRAISEPRLLQPPLQFVLPSLSGVDVVLSTEKLTPLLEAATRIELKILTEEARLEADIQAADRLCASGTPSDKVCSHLCAAWKGRFFPYCLRFCHLKFIQNLPATFLREAVSQHHGAVPEDDLASAISQLLNQCASLHPNDKLKTLIVATSYCDFAVQHIPSILQRNLTSAILEAQKSASKASARNRLLFSGIDLVGSYRIGLAITHIALGQYEAWMSFLKEAVDNDKSIPINWDAVKRYLHPNEDWIPSRLASFPEALRRTVHEAMDAWIADAHIHSLSRWLRNAGQTELKSFFTSIKMRWKMEITSSLPKDASHSDRKTTSMPDAKGKNEHVQLDGSAFTLPEGVSLFNWNPLPPLASI